LTALLAAAPPLVAALLLLARVSPVRAALAALACGLLVLPAFTVTPGELAAAEGRAMLTGLEVVLIILGGVLLFELMAVGGAHERLAEWAVRVSADPGRRVLAVCLGITPFAESVTGFGVGVIIAAPLLLRMGLAPRAAASVALLGLVAVPWGALAPGTLVGSRLTGVPFDALGVATAELSGPVFLIAGFTALVIGTGLPAAVRRLPDLGFVALALWAGIWLANRALGTPLAGAVGACAGFAAVLALVAAEERRPPPSLDGRTARALSPYALLVCLLLASRVAAEVAPMPEPVTAVVLSPATWLVATCAATPALLGGAGRSGAAVRLAYRRWLPVAQTTLAFLALGALMTVSGMASALAEGGAPLGRAYLLLAPWIGGLGGFLTGSNAGANAMFAAPQAEVARALGYPLETLVAAQNVSASLLTMASAPRVALVLALMGPAVRMGDVLKPVLLADAAVLVALAAVLLVAG
jgi:lactate permease